MAVDERGVRTSRTTFGRPRRRAAIAVVTATVVAICAHGTASAATVHREWGGLVFTAETGERNLVTVERASSIGAVGVPTGIPFFYWVGADPGGLVAFVTDTGAPLTTASEDCLSLNAHKAACAFGGYGRASLELGDRDDRATTLAPAAWVHGGAGNDHVRASARFIEVWGEAGGDVLVGSEYGDLLNGGEGPDQITGAQGDDGLEGGPDKDEIDAGGGKDIVWVRDGTADSVTCGSGNDYVEADAVDVVGGDCEQRR